MVLSTSRFLGVFLLPLPRFGALARGLFDTEGDFDSDIDFWKSVSIRVNLRSPLVFFRALALAAWRLGVHLFFLQ